MGVIHWTMDGRILDANDRFLRMVGYSRQDLREGRIRWLEMTPPEFANRDRQAMVENRLTGRNNPYEKAYIRKDGSRVPILLSSVMTDETRGEGIAFVLDLTQRKHDEEALRRSELEARQRLAEIEAIYNWAPIGLCVFDRELRWQRLNKRIAEINGVPIEDHLGKTPREVVPDVADQAEAALRHILVTGEPLLDSEITGTTIAQPGVVRTWNERWVPIKDNEERVVGVSVVAEETTERKRVEAEREAALHENERLYQEAQRANRLKDDFIATLSHELRNPLNVTLGWISMLERGLDDPEVRRRAVAAIERNTRMQAQLLSDLLDVTRIARGKLMLHEAGVDIALLIGTAVETMRLAAAEKGIVLVSHFAGLPAVRGDPDRLQQVVWNLFSNALKFTPEGGRIEVAVELKEGWVEISVRDTGVGISPEFLPLVFDRFRQDDTFAARTELGLGLGLAIVKHLVELHHGTVSAASPGPGQGSTFTIRLPVTASRSESSTLSQDHS